MVKSILMVGDVTAAVRIIASDSCVITSTAVVVTALRLKPTPSPLDLRPPTTEAVSQKLSVSEVEVMVALKAFRPSSAGGVDGLRLRHLKDLVAPQTADGRTAFVETIANLCSKFLRGLNNSTCSRHLFATNLTALLKRDDGIRPIAIGNVFRRLAS